jgi:hypothetical protein
MRLRAFWLKIFGNEKWKGQVNTFLIEKNITSSPRSARTGRLAEGLSTRPPSPAEVKSYNFGWRNPLFMVKNL